MKNTFASLLVLLLSSNLSSQQFTKVTTGPVAGDFGQSHSSNWIDYDNDSDLDLFVTNGGGGHSSLYKNNGNGTFTTITTGALVTEVGNSSFGSSWGDYDNDGDQDVFVANSYQSENSFLYTSNGDGTFVRRAMGPSARAAAWGDYDNDGDLDLYITTYSKNVLFRNNGDGSFISINGGAIVQDEAQSYGCSWGDYDNDGDLDLFVANFTATSDQNNFLYSNNGDGTFTKIIEGPVANEGGYSYSGSWGDYDNDGNLDLFVANNYNGNGNNFLYRNNGNGTFPKLLLG